MLLHRKNKRGGIKNVSSRITTPLFQTVGSWNQLPVVALDILRSALLFLCRFCGSFLNGLTSLGGSRLGCSLLCLLLALLGHLPVVLVVAKVNESLEEF